MRSTSATAIVIAPARMTPWSTARSTRSSRVTSRASTRAWLVLMACPPQSARRSCTAPRGRCIRRARQALVGGLRQLAQRLVRGGGALLVQLVLEKVGPPGRGGREVMLELLYDRVLGTDALRDDRTSGIHVDGPL